MMQKKKKLIKLVPQHQIVLKIIAFNQSKVATPKLLQLKMGLNSVMEM